MFRTCACCATVQEVASDRSLVCCNDCKLRLYCSDACREQDVRSHKKDGFCQALKNLWGRHNRAYKEFRSNLSGPARVAWYRERFGEAFDGRNFIQLMKGCNSQDPFYRPVLDAQYEIALELARHPTLAKMVEQCLPCLLHVKEQTYLVDPYNLDTLMAAVLLKLYYEDDAVGVILYWLDWRARGPNIDDLRDNAIENRAVGMWPYRIINDARFDDLVDRFNTFPAEHVGVAVPIEFPLILFVIKMRFITFYRKRAEVVNLFLYGYNDGVGRRLQGDQRAHVLSFLIEGGREQYFAQRNHPNRLMDYIDERDATLLRSLVDPAAKAERGDDQLCFETFLNDYANGEPVICTIKSLLMERYGIGDDDDVATADQNHSGNKKRAAADSIDSDHGAQKLPRHDN